MARAYTLVRIQPNGNEIVEQTFSTVGMTEAQLQALRAQGLAAARTLKSQQQGRRYVVYGPTDVDGALDPNDRVWDSACDL